MSDVVIFVQDPLGHCERARCKHCSARLLYSKPSACFDDSRFICTARNKKFISGRGFACSVFNPKIGYKVIQSNLQLNLL